MLMDDSFYYYKAMDISKKSNCSSRQIGAIIVKDDVILSEGYNGPPVGIPACVPHRYYTDYVFKTELLKYRYIRNDNKDDMICPRRRLGIPNGDGYEWCPAVHAERRAILNSIKNNVDIKDSVMYMTCGVPCSRCLIEIIEMGIKELVVTDMYIYEEISRYLIENSGIKIRLYDFLEGGKIEWWEEVKELKA
jgi:dCMP deaminase